MLLFGAAQASALTIPGFAFATAGETLMVDEAQRRGDRGRSPMPGAATA